MAEMRDFLHLEAIIASGKTVGDNIAQAQNFNPDVIAPVISRSALTEALLCCTAILRPTPRS